MLVVDVVALSPHASESAASACTVQYSLCALVLMLALSSCISVRIETNCERHDVRMNWGLVEVASCSGRGDQK